MRKIVKHFLIFIYTKSKLQSRNFNTDRNQNNKLFAELQHYS